MGRGEEETYPVTLTGVDDGEANGILYSSTLRSYDGRKLSLTMHCLLDGSTSISKRLFFRSFLVRRKSGMYILGRDSSSLVFDVVSRVYF